MENRLSEREAVFRFINPVMEGSYYSKARKQEKTRARKQESKKRPEQERFTRVLKGGISK
jgi:hypothetical protein